MRIPFTLVFLLASLPTLKATEPGDATAIGKILATHCAACHGANGTVEGGLNYITDLDKLIARRKIIPGNAADSPVFRRIANGSMPPDEEHSRPTDAERAQLKQWITSGAATTATTQPRPRISDDDRDQLILSDLEKISPRARRFQRYFTLTHLTNAQLGAGELQTHRNALAKLLNSLSWHSEIRVPEPIDPAQSLLRVDLRWFLWDAATWNRLLDEYPYGIQRDTAVARVIMVSTGTRMPTIRADWFVATASRAPLYYDLLQLPGNLAELERTLRIDAAFNIQQDRVIRLGFNGSGISRFNRILERHPSVHGAYWRSYDFNAPDQNLIERGTLLPDRKNIFAHPLGPGLVAEPFQHVGGEVVFTLPNGLHGYYLMNAVNDRLDKGPQAIVSDPKRPDRSVEAGVSCMSCHVSGILPKTDQVRDHLAKNPTSFSRQDAERIRALYLPHDETSAIMAEDAKRYLAALAKTGNRAAKTESVSTITLQYEADLDLVNAAAEVGLTPDHFRKQIQESESLTRNLGALRVAGGTVSRPVWLQTFGDLVRDLRLGTLFQANVSANQNADATAEVDPLEQSGDVANQMVYSPDGKRALVAAADRSVRLRDVESGRDLKFLIGHTGSVWSVAFSPDAKYGISGGIDGVVRIWDLFRGTESLRLDGHDSLVSAVAFSPNGRHVISGGYDGAVIWWDIRGHGPTGTAVRRLDLQNQSIHAIALHPTQKRAAVAVGKDVLLWDTATGDVVRRWVAHDRAVTCVRFLESGQQLATGGDDGHLKIWDMSQSQNGHALADLTGHSGSIRDIDQKSGTPWLLSAGADQTVRLWNRTTQSEVARFRPHTASVLAATFLPSGTRTLSGDRTLTNRIWDISRFLQGHVPSSAAPRTTPMTIPRAD
ncbi:MAG: c-type cytochrome [Bacteroidales bacterium]|nr:c-type cytochrome [Bacteroidales bacterium]